MREVPPCLILNWAVTAPPLAPGHGLGEGLPGDAARSLQQLAPPAASLGRFPSLIPVIVMI